MARRSKRDDEAVFENGEYAEDFRESAIEALNSFFGGKQSFYGGPVSEEEMLSSSAIDTVMKTQMDGEWQDVVHYGFEQLPPDRFYEDATVPWSVHSLLQILEEMRNKSISQDFHPGLCLLYLRICKGMAFC